MCLYVWHESRLLIGTEAWHSKPIMQIHSFVYWPIFICSGSLQRNKSHTNSLTFTEQSNIWFIWKSKVLYLKVHLLLPYYDYMRQFNLYKALSCFTTTTSTKKKKKKTSVEKMILTKTHYRKTCSPQNRETTVFFFFLLPLGFFEQMKINFSPPNKFSVWAGSNLKVIKFFNGAILK